MKRKAEEDRGNQELRAQLELLRKGCRATGWACREVLSLTATPSREDVIDAVHKAIHKFRNDETIFAVDDCIAAITAGWMLLRDGGK